MSKCIGCGVALQTEQKEAIGYAKSLDQTLCERCFRIIHYNDYKTVMKTNEEFVSILKEIDKTKDLVLYVVDLFAFHEVVSEIRNYLTNPMILILTKRDLLPKSLYEEKIKEYMEQYHLNPLDSILISSKKSEHFDELIALIREHQTSSNVYVVGATNAGKSTMINQLLHHYSSKTPMLTTSMLPSTTLHNIEVELDEHLTLIDTPGLLETGNITSILTGEQLKKILPKKEIRPLTYQIKTPQTITIDELVQIDCLTCTNLTIFVSNILKIERYYKIKTMSNDFEKHSFQIKKPQDIVISGLGFIKVTKPCQIEIGIPKGVSIYTRNPLI